MSLLEQDTHQTFQRKYMIFLFKLILNQHPNLTNETTWVKTNSNEKTVMGNLYPEVCFSLARCLFK